MKHTNNVAERLHKNWIPQRKQIKQNISES